MAHLLTNTEVLRLVPQAAGQDAIVGDCIDAVEGMANGFCRRTLTSTAQDEYYDTGTDQEVVQLLNWPVTAVTAVTDNAQADAPTTLTTAQYIRMNNAGILTRVGTYWTAGTAAVRVQYTAGYTAATCPQMLRQALLKLASWWFEQRGNVGVQQESSDGWSGTYEDVVDGVPKSVAAMLRQYRKPGLG
jgi:uncharacterized phiE125 gp8 family phage protein